MRIAIFSDSPGWHGDELREAFSTLGTETAFLSLRDCGMRLRTGATRLILPGLDGALPDACLVPGISGGTLEEVVFRLDVLHALATLQIPVYNDARAIERSVDKSLTSFVLAHNGLPTPPTLVTSDHREAEALTARTCAAGHQLVCKPLFGSQGEGVVRIEHPEDLPDETQVNGVWYLQGFIHSDSAGAADWRLFVIGGRVKAAMRRTSTDWLTNVAQGGSCHAALPERDVRRMAERAVAVLGMDYAGVDLMRDADGNWWLLEVNSIPAWKGLQGVCGLDIAVYLGHAADYQAGYLLMPFARAQDARDVAVRLRRDHGIDCVEPDFSEQPAGLLLRTRTREDSDRLFERRSLASRSSSRPSLEPTRSSAIRIRSSGQSCGHCARSAGPSRRVPR